MGTVDAQRDVHRRPQHGARNNVCIGEYRRVHVCGMRACSIVHSSIFTCERGGPVVVGSGCSNAVRSLTLRDALPGVAGATSLLPFRALPPNPTFSVPAVVVIMVMPVR